MLNCCHIAAAAAAAPLTPKAALAQQFFLSFFLSFSLYSKHFKYQKRRDAVISLVLILHSVGTTGRLSIIFHSPPNCSFNTAREGREKREERALQFPSIASFVLPRTFARSFPICKENAEIGIEFDWIELIHTLSITTTPINDVPLWLHSRVRSSSRPTTIINNDAKL